MNTTVIDTAETVLEKAHQAAPFIEQAAKVWPGFGNDIAMAIAAADAMVPAILETLNYLKEVHGMTLFEAIARLQAHINPHMPNMARLDQMTRPQ